MLPTLLSLMVFSSLQRFYMPLCTCSWMGLCEAHLGAVCILFNGISTKQRKHTDIHANHALKVMLT